MAPVLLQYDAGPLNGSADAAIRERDTNSSALPGSSIPGAAPSAVSLVTSDPGSRGAATTASTPASTTMQAPGATRPGRRRTVARAPQPRAVPKSQSEQPDRLQELAVQRRRLAFVAMLKLLEAQALSAEALQELTAPLSGEELGQVAEERALGGRCGNPLCDQPFAWRAGASYRAENGEVVRADSDNFCSAPCRDFMGRFAAGLGNPMDRLRPEALRAAAPRSSAAAADADEGAAASAASHDPRGQGRRAPPAGARGGGVTTMLATVQERDPIQLIEESEEAAASLVVAARGDAAAAAAAVEGFVPRGPPSAATSSPAASEPLEVLHLQPVVQRRAEVAPGVARTEDGRASAAAAAAAAGRGLGGGAGGTAARTQHPSLPPSPVAQRAADDDASGSASRQSAGAGPGDVPATVTAGADGAPAQPARGNAVPGGHASSSGGAPPAGAAVGAPRPILKRPPWMRQAQRARSDERSARAPPSAATAAAARDDAAAPAAPQRQRRVSFGAILERSERSSVGPAIEVQQPVLCFSVGDPSGVLEGGAEAGGAEACPGDGGVGARFGRLSVMDAAELGLAPRQVARLGEAVGAHVAPPARRAGGTGDEGGPTAPPPPPPPPLPQALRMRFPPAAGGACVPPPPHSVAAGGTTAGGARGGGRPTANGGSHSLAGAAARAPGAPPAAPAPRHPAPANGAAPATSRAGGGGSPGATAGACAGASAEADGSADTGASADTATSQLHSTSEPGRNAPAGSGVAGPAPPTRKFRPVWRPRSKVVQLDAPPGVAPAAGGRGSPAARAAATRAAADAVPPAPPTPHVVPAAHHVQATAHGPATARGNGAAAAHATAAVGVVGAAASGGADVATGDDTASVCGSGGDSVSDGASDGSDVSEQEWYYDEAGETVQVPSRRRPPASAALNGARGGAAAAHTTVTGSEESDSDEGCESEGEGASEGEVDSGSGSDGGSEGSGGGGYSAAAPFFSAPPRGYAVQLSKFGLMWTLLHEWVSPATREHVGVRPQGTGGGGGAVGDDDAGRPLAVGVTLPGERAGPSPPAATVEAAATMVEELRRAVTATLAALQVGEPAALVVRELEVLAGTLRFLRPVPDLPLAHWQLVATLMLAAVSRWRLTTLRPLFSRQAPHPLLGAWLQDLRWERPHFDTLLDLFEESFEHCVKIHGSRRGCDGDGGGGAGGIPAALRQRWHAGCMCGAAARRRRHQSSSAAGGGGRVGVSRGATLAGAGANAGNSSSSSSIDGRWHLCFSTSTKVRAFQYIPVREELVVDLQGRTIALQSAVGPFRFHISGAIHSWDEASGQLGFQFNQVDVLLLGNKIWQVRPATKPKVYTFFYVTPGLAAARSSAGGLSLLVATP